MAVDWSIIDSGKSSAKENMALDIQLLANAGSHSQPLLHLYDWSVPSATYGYFTDPYLVLKLEAVRKIGLDLVRRPTGGGIIFHMYDFAFSIVIPSNDRAYSVNTLENYAFVNSIIIEALKRFNGVDSMLHPIESPPLDGHASRFCMAKPTKYDVMVDGRKVGGGAQRRTRDGFLHQGSIALSLPNEEFMSSILIPETRVLEAMRMHTYPLLKDVVAAESLKDIRCQLQETLKSVVLEMH